MNNPTKIHPVIGGGASSSQQQIPLGINRNETPLRLTVNPTQDNLLGHQTTQQQQQLGVSGGGILLGMNASGNTGQANNNNLQGLGTARRDDLIIDTNTNHNVGNTNMQLSPTSNKSYLKISGYAAIEQLKKQFLGSVETVTNTRLVEVIGGLASYEEKNKAIRIFGLAWQEMLAILSSIEEKISVMSFDSDVLYPNSEQYVSDLVVNSVKEIEGQYVNLITSSSLRFLDTVCTVHDLQYKHLVNMRFDIRQWRKNNLDHIKVSQPLNRKGSLFSQAQIGGGAAGSAGGAAQNQKSMLATLCGCCYPSNNGNNLRMSSQQLLRKQSSQDQGAKKMVKS